MTRRALQAIALAACLCAPAVAQPATFQYTVQPGDSCASIAQAVYGDRRRYDLIHAHNDLGPLPHDLRAGRVLELLRPDLAQAEATVRRAERRVEHRPPGLESWRSAARGQVLQRGHQVTTHEDAFAELRFRNGSVLQMRERSLVIIMGEGRHVSRSTGRATLERGALRAHLSRLSQLQVATPSARTTVTGDAWVGVDQNGTSRVANRSGRTMTVRGESGRVRLPVGTGTLVRRGERPGRPRPLPEAPRWSNDLAGRFVGFAGAGAAIAASWEPVEGASHYRVEVARRPDGTDVVAADDVPSTQSHFRASGLSRGAYYVSVSTVDAEGFEGRPGPRRAMVVLEARLLPPGGGTHIATQSPVRVVPGTAVVAPSGYRCGLGRGQGHSLLTLRELGRHRMNCVDRNDRPVPGGDVVVVRARPEFTRAPVLRRGHTSRVRFRLQSPVTLPERMVAHAPVGIAVGPVSRTRNGEFEIDVGASSDAPEHVAIDLQVAVGTERLGVATLSLSVR